MNDKQAMFVSIGKDIIQIDMCTLCFIDSLNMYSIFGSRIQRFNHSYSFSLLSRMDNTQKYVA